MSQRTVLIVEDEENLLAAITYNLKRDGYRVYSATDGERGLEIAREVPCPAFAFRDPLQPLIER